MQAPYKSPYTFQEFWTTMIQGAPYKNYAKANPKEAASLEDHAQKKIEMKGDFIPGGITNTFMGDALLMTIMSLH